MPCWQVRTQSVEMSKINLDVLKSALEADGWESVTLVEGTSVMAHRANGSVSVKWLDGRLNVTVRTSSAINNYIGAVKRAYTNANNYIGAVKRAYTNAAFRRAAKRAGFSVKTKSATKVVATRRRF